jgi:hypothetical protein
MRSLVRLVLIALAAGAGLTAGPGSAAAERPRATSLPACRATSCATPIVVTQGFPDGTTGVTLGTRRQAYTWLSDGTTATTVIAPGLAVTRLSDGRSALTTLPVLGRATFTHTSDGATFPTLASGRSAYTPLAPRLPSRR